MACAQVQRRPLPLYDSHRGGMDAVVRGLVEQPCQTYDQFFTKQISKSLFTEKPPFGVGMDLISLNIQRGRDHGLPGTDAVAADTDKRLHTCTCISQGLPFQVTDSWR